MTASQMAHDSDDEFSTSHLLPNDTEAQTKSKAITPIPLVPLAALCLARLADPVNFSQILPYVNEYMIRLHITDDIDRVGLYSGIVESAFAFCQLLTIFSWAKLSDRIGRKPVILAGIAGLAISTLNFGLGKSLGYVILFRCIGGLFSGHVAALHAVLAELSDTTNQHITFPIYGVFWPLGGVLGPLIGGTFSNPAQHGGIFYTAFWKEYPYFLPCLVTAIMAVLTVLINWAFLKETLASKRVKSIDDPPTASNDQHEQQANYGTINKSNRSRAVSDASASSATQSDETVATATEQELDTSARTLLRIQAVRSLCYSGTALCMQGTAYDIGIVLFCFSPIASGGLGFSPPQIGTTLAISGCMSVALQILVMPHLLRRFHAGLLHDWCMRIWPLVFLTIPILNIIRKMELAEGEMLMGGVLNEVPVGPWLVIGLGVNLLLSKLGALAFSLSMLLVKIHSPSPQQLGSVNGLVQVSWCISRAVAPAFISTIFSISTEKHILNGYFWSPVMAALCLLGCWASYPLRPKSG